MRSKRERIILPTHSDTKNDQYEQKLYVHIQIISRRKLEERK